MKKILVLLFAGVIMVANNMSSRIVAGTSAATTSPVVQTSPRLEVVFANHVVELVEKSEGDNSELAREARRLFEESSLKRLRADLEEKLGHGDELKRARKFRELWKQMDEQFGLGAKKTPKSFPHAATTGVNVVAGAPQKAPWPLCVPKGCK